MAQIILRDIIVRHNIPVRTQYNITHLIIFYNPKDHTTWYWRTSTVDGLRYKEHCTYSIIGTDEGNFKLSRIREVSEKESEQDLDTKPNALDILLSRVKK